MNGTELGLIAVALVAATVNGGLGYGFSSIVVPVALLIVPNRTLNPALVLLEVGINVAVLAQNWRAIRSVVRPSLPLLAGAVPGVILGSLLLQSANASWLKLATYTVLLPLILVQATGWRRPVSASPRASTVLGAAIGALYATTTISGPPLALFLNNQGLAKQEFRASLALFRIVESSATAVAYLALGLYSADSVHTSSIMLPGVLVGLGLGHALLRPLNSETFRRLCMGIDAFLVEFGLVRTAIGLKLAPPEVLYAVFAILAVFTTVLLWRHLRNLRLPQTLSLSVNRT